jgi:protein tyrosine phosphatase
MNDPDGLQKISGLLESVTSRNRSFLDKCAETKLMAVKNPHRAHQSYKALATQLMSSSEGNFGTSDNCLRYAERIRYDLDSDYLNASVLDVMQDLRESYFEDVLRPAVRQYLSGQGPTKEEIENLYESVLQLNGLVETLDFIAKLQNT